MDYQFLSSTSLFRDIKKDDIEKLLLCQSARTKKYKKGNIILHTGDHIKEIGLVLSGSVNIVVNFYWGNSRIFGHIEKGDIFGENYAVLPENTLSKEVVAAEDAEVLFLNLGKLLTTCKKGCAFHNEIIHNLFKISAVKSLNLSSRMMHTAPKSIRERVLSYLSELAITKSNTHFTIPFSRQELADYLGVDRSALSNELGKMRRDGLIEFQKNEFILKENHSIYG